MPFFTYLQGCAWWLLLGSFFFGKVESKKGKTKDVGTSDNVR
jgi:hypothetical protein